MKKTKTIAVYPGSFDPITNGHIDIIKRASQILDEVIVALLINKNKTPLLTNIERKRLIDLSVKGMKNVKTDKFSGLLVDYMKKVGAKTAIRGLRAVSDLEYEFQIAHTNRKLYKDMETVFLMPSSNYTYLSSSIVRQVYSMGGEMECMLPNHVSKLLKKAR
ncbi:MAG: pantetheine-phosphate adenylyltransferase [Elusimicrobiaceae bacterium]|nr:pantetheine-phosphate adenylyltransferase [Elusimicrobiaceae bacterium]